MNHRRAEVERDLWMSTHAISPLKQTSWGTAWLLVEAKESENKNKRNLERTVFLLCVLLFCLLLRIKENRRALEG